MTDVSSLPETDPAHLFLRGAAWADMDLWHEQVAEIRRDHPVLTVDVPGWAPLSVLTRHEDVFAVSRDSDSWANTTRSVLAPDAHYQGLDAMGIVPRSLVHLDGHEHTSHRKVTNDWFKPAAVKGRQPRIDEIADLFIGRMREMDGACDFARDIAQPYTLRVIMDIYGVPETDEPLMLELTQGIFGAEDPEYLGDAENPMARASESVISFIQYFNEITDDRRACPTDDLASVIAHGEVDGCPMGDAERLWYYIIVATAGHDTTSFALAGGLEALLRDPAQIEALKADRDLINAAADEFIRWTSPVRHFMRYATADTEVRGTKVPEGSRVLLSYPSANRDEDVFSEPMRFDVTRPDLDKLLSFGVGAHFCLGAQFARREIRTFMDKLLDELAWIEPDTPASWAESHFVSGVKHLPIRYGFR